jgi:hypothetical protein
MLWKKAVVTHFKVVFRTYIWSSHKAANNSVQNFHRKTSLPEPIVRCSFKFQFLQATITKLQRGPMKNRSSDFLDTFRPQSAYMTPCYSNSSLSMLLCICSISVKCVQPLLLKNPFHDGSFARTVGLQLFRNSTSTIRNKTFSTALQISVSSSLVIIT